jgi:hypothetical protein
MTKNLHAPNTPRPIGTRAREGVPVFIDNVRIEAVQESWLVEDRWWTDQPIRRRFHDLQNGGWYTQTA